MSHYNHKSITAKAERARRESLVADSQGTNYKNLERVISKREKPAYTKNKHVVRQLISAKD